MEYSTRTSTARTIPTITSPDGASPATRMGNSLLRVAMIATGILLMGWAATSGTGCAGNGKYTTERKNIAKARIDTLKASTEYTMALQAFEAGNLDKARRHADQAITLSPTVARNWVLRGRVMIEKNELEAANESLIKAAELDATDVDAIYYQGILAERVNRRTEARDFYVKASDMSPNSPQYVIAAAEMMMDLGELDQAESFLRQRQDTFRHTAGIQQTLGHIALLREDYAAAEVAFNEARLLANDEFQVLEDLAHAQFMQGKFAQAETNLSRLLRSEKYKDRRDLQHMRARCLVGLTRNTEARDAFLALTRDEQGASDYEAWNGLGEIAYQLRDTSRLRMSFARMIAMSPERPQGYVLRGMHQRRAGDLKGAEESFRKATDLEQSDQANAKNFIMLGLIQQAQNKSMSARNAFRKASELDPANQIASRLAQDQDLAAKLAIVEE